MPIMGYMGLPGETGLIWATSLLGGLYGGMIAFSNLSSRFELTTAQATTLGAITLMAHGLSIEARITQKVGVSFWYIVGLRIGAGLLFGWLINP